jgi:uncharacterized membrane protein
MHEILLIISAAIHLFAAVVWIGGIFFILFVALPSARKILEQPGPLMGDLSKRFVPLANISILLLLVSGILMSLLSHTLSEIASLNSIWSQTLSFKIIIALMMTVIHFYRGLLLTPRIAKLTSEGVPSEQVSRLQSLSLNLVKVNLLCGATVLLITGMLYAYRG